MLNNCELYIKVATCQNCQQSWNYFIEGRQQWEEIAANNAPPMSTIYKKLILH